MPYSIEIAFIRLAAESKGASGGNQYTGTERLRASFPEHKNRLCAASRPTNFEQ